MKNRKTGAIAIFLAGVFLAGSVFLPTQASAASSGEIRKQIDALEEEKDALQAQMDDLERQMGGNVTEMREIVEQKTRIDQQMFLLCQQMDNINEQISAYRVLIADKQEELNGAQAQYAELSDRYRERVRAMEEEGELSYWSVLFKANSFADLLDRLNMIEEIAAADRRRLRELSAAAQRVAQAQEALEAGKAALEETKAELDAAQGILEEKRAEADALLSQLVAKGEEYALRMEQAEEEQNRLLEEIARQEDAYDEAAYQEWLATYVPPATEAPAESGGGSGQESGIPAESGGWQAPLSSIYVSSPFGMRLHPVLGIYRMHNGVDLAAPSGTPIYAARGGQVTIAATEEEAGNYVMINHGDGYRSVYMHMTYYVVSPGDYVAQGQLIGYVGDSGLTTGPHLHFGISYNGTYVNPMDYL